MGPAHSLPSTSTGAGHSRMESSWRAKLGSSFPQSRGGSVVTSVHQTPAGKRELGRPLPCLQGLRPTGVSRPYLTHLLVEVLLQARNALKRVDIETYTAAGGKEGRKRAK